MLFECVEVVVLFVGYLECFGGYVFVYDIVC